jgi:hypothetical protein
MKSKCFVFLLLFASSFLSNSYAGEKELKLCYATAVFISAKAKSLGNLEIEKQYNYISLSLNQIYSSRYGTSEYLDKEAVILVKSGLKELPNSELQNIIEECTLGLKQGKI